MEGYALPSMSVSYFFSLQLGFLICKAGGCLNSWIQVVL
jgi:hypothetical protein